MRLPGHSKLQKRTGAIPPWRNWQLERKSRFEKPYDVGDDACYDVYNTWIKAV